MNMQIGIDLGGTKIEIICLKPNGEQVLRRRIPSPQGDYIKTVKTISEIVLSLKKLLNNSISVGIGIPGSISSSSGLVKNANSTWLIGKPLEEDLTNTIGQPIKLANDANCFILSECIDGAAKDAMVAFGVILGTGVGGGISVNKVILSGSNSITGEWGHNPLPWQSADEFEMIGKCYCGKIGCIETFLNGSALSKLHSNVACGQIALSAKEINILLEKNNRQAKKTLRIYSSRLARSLSSVINLIDPDIIVLGGGLSNINLLYELVPDFWHSWVFSDQIKTKLVKNQHGDSSGVRGAAWLWSNKVNII